MAGTVGIEHRRLNTCDFDPSPFPLRSNIEPDVSGDEADCSLFREQIVFCDMKLSSWLLRRYLLLAYCVVGVQCRRLI